MVERAKLIGSARRFVADQRGATAIEYAMIASGIALAIAVAVRALGTQVYDLYSNVAAAFN